MTAPVDGSILATTPVHVFLNPTVYDKLDPLAAQVVMTHEVVHAITGAAVTAGPPLWLIEGFADYVALRDVGLLVAAVSLGLLARKHTGTRPEADAR